MQGNLLAGLWKYLEFILILIFVLNSVPGLIEEILVLLNHNFNLSLRKNITSDYNGYHDIDDTNITLRCVVWNGWKINKIHHRSIIA